MQLSILGNGFIGQTLHRLACDSMIFDRTGAHNLVNHDHEVLVVTAPTGNRLAVAQNPDKDLENCKNIIEQIAKCRFKQLVLIGTVDAYAKRKSQNAEPDTVCPQSPYGQNRWFLENALSQISACSIVRLPSLIHPSIQKNILYDLKTKNWLDKINVNSSIQWYPLQRLNEDILLVASQRLKFQNLCSPPIHNRQIVFQYFPHLLAELEKNTIQDLHYDVKNSYQTYSIDLDQIWSSFDEYFLKGSVDKL
jgi:hypothetical protein